MADDIDHPTLLCADIGNSRLKWQVSVDRHVVAAGSCPSDTAALSIPASLIPRIQTCALSGVASDEALAQVQIRADELGLPRWIRLRSEARRGCLRNGYTNPAQLGVDRWLALVAAEREFGLPIVVVDAGTAITVDGVDSEGMHLGGYILPGLRSMLSALGVATARIATDTIRFDSMTARTCSTEEAVAAGVLGAANGLVDRAVAEVKRCSRQQQPAVVLTGGDGRVLMRRQPDFHWRRNLVLDGIRIVATESVFPAQ